MYEQSAWQGFNDAIEALEKVVTHFDEAGVPPRNDALLRRAAERVYMSATLHPTNDAAVVVSREALESLRWQLYEQK